MDYQDKAEAEFRQAARSLNLSIRDLYEIAEDKYFTYFTPTDKLKKGVWMNEEYKRKIQNDYWILASMLLGERIVRTPGK